MCAFDKFLRNNNLKKTQIAEFLGVTNAFVTQLCSGKRKLPQDKLTLIKANALGWDVSMLTQPENPMTNEPKADGLVEYLERKVSDQEILIRELYQQIGMLEAKLDLARKGEIASIVAGSFDADAV